MTPQENFVFAKNIDSAYTPKDYVNCKGDFMYIEVSGTFSSGSFIVEGKTDINNELYTPIAAVNISTMSVVKNGNISGAGIYAVDIACLQLIRVRVESISGGSVTILGRVTMAE